MLGSTEESISVFTEILLDSTYLRVKVTDFTRYSFPPYQALTCRILATSLTGNSLAFFDVNTGIIVSFSPLGIF